MKIEYLLKKTVKIQLITLKGLEFKSGILQFTITNHVLLPFFTDIKKIYIQMHAAFLCLQISIHNTVVEKEMVIKSA